jgi:hypothetical protein
VLCKPLRPAPVEEVGALLRAPRDARPGPLPLADLSRCGGVRLERFRLADNLLPLGRSAAVLCHAVDQAGVVAGYRLIERVACLRARVELLHRISQRGVALGKAARKLWIPQQGSRHLLSLCVDPRVHIFRRRSECYELLQQACRHIICRRTAAWHQSQCQLAPQVN